jgi:hypothetical protein
MVPKEERPKAVRPLAIPFSDNPSELAKTEGKREPQHTSSKKCKRESRAGEKGAATSIPSCGSWASGGRPWAPKIRKLRWPTV